MPRSIVHVSVDLTMETRCTMRNLRLRRLLWFACGGELPISDVDAIADLLQRSQARSHQTRRSQSVDRRVRHLVVVSGVHAML
jgi:hypothetical protein